MAAKYSRRVFEMNDVKICECEKSQCWYVRTVPLCTYCGGFYKYVTENQIELVKEANRQLSQNFEYALKDYIKESK